MSHPNSQKCSGPNLSSKPDEGCLLSFYVRADALVERQLEAAMEDELNAALNQIAKVEEHWSW
jgi:hypothetical protein